MTAPTTGYGHSMDVGRHRDVLKRTSRIPQIFIVTSWSAVHMDNDRGSDVQKLECNCTQKFGLHFISRKCIVQLHFYYTHRSLMFKFKIGWISESLLIFNETSAKYLVANSVTACSAYISRHSRSFPETLTHLVCNTDRVILSSIWYCSSNHYWIFFKGCLKIIFRVFQASRQ